MLGGWIGRIGQAGRDVRDRSGNRATSRTSREPARACAGKWHISISLGAMVRLLCSALLASFVGACLALAALYASWTVGLPDGTFGAAQASDRAIAAYVLLFGFHLVNALFDQATGAFRHARAWQDHPEPDAAAFTPLWPGFLAFWAFTHGPLAVAGSYYFALWSWQLTLAWPLDAEALQNILGTVGAMARPPSLADAALRLVAGAGIAALALYAGRVGVVALPPDAKRFGLRRLTDQPLWAVLTLVCAVEALRALLRRLAPTDARVAVPLMCRAEASNPRRTEVAPRLLLTPSDRAARAGWPLGRWSAARTRTGGTRRLGSGGSWATATSPRRRANCCCPSRGGRRSLRSRASLGP